MRYLIRFDDQNQYIDVPDDLEGNYVKLLQSGFMTQVTAVKGRYVVKIYSSSSTMRTGIFFNINDVKIAIIKWLKEVK